MSLWCVYFHAHKTFHCLNWGTIFVGERQRLFTLLATRINTRSTRVNPTHAKYSFCLKVACYFQKLTNDRITIWEKLRQKWSKRFCWRSCKKRFGKGEGHVGIGNHWCPEGIIVAMCFDNNWNVLIPTNKNIKSKCNIEIRRLWT